MEPSPSPLTRFVAGAIAGEVVARWRLLAALWAAGGAMGVLVGLLGDIGGTATAGAVALGLALLLGGLARQLDQRLLGPLLALGATTVTLALLAAGAAAEPLMLLHAWAAAAAWYFLSYRGAAALSLYAIGLGALSVAVLPGDGRHAVLLWVLTAATVIVVGGLTAALRLRADQLARQLRDLVDRDELTGVLNRRGFSARVAAALARQRRTAETVALVLCDLDHFGVVNDHFGHHAGDELLRRFAACCDAELRATDAVARVGGEQFALLLPDADAAAAAAVAERIRGRIARELRTPDDAPVTASFGVAAAPVHAPDAGGLLDAADGALHAAKRAGRDLVLRAGTVWPVAG